MDRCAFGHHTRIDKCDLQGPSLINDVLVDVASGIEPERTLWTSVIAFAANDFLMFGLGRNGSTRDEFWFSVEFFFHTRASRPATWQSSRVQREVIFDEALGRRVNRVQTIPDEALRAMCLDSIWAHLRFPLSLDTFLRRLRAERSELLSRNWQQVSHYLGLHRSFAECESVLVCPESPEALSQLLYAPRGGSLAVAA